MPDNLALRITVRPKRFSRLVIALASSTPSAKRRVNLLVINKSPLPFSLASTGMTSSTLALPTRRALASILRLEIKPALGLVLLLTRTTVILPKR